MEEIFVSLQQLTALFLTMMCLLQSLAPQACKLVIKSKAGAIKCCKETKITATPNESYNIPFILSKTCNIVKISSLRELQARLAKLVAQHFADPKTQV